MGDILGAEAVEHVAALGHADRAILRVGRKLAASGSGPFSGGRERSPAVSAVGLLQELDVGAVGLAEGQVDDVVAGRAVT